jgi:hypothetical protein
MKGIGEKYRMFYYYCNRIVRLRVNHDSRVGIKGFREGSCRDG